jgi:hypothetical protein
MFFILLTFLAALFLESIGTIVSIQGLCLLFGIEPLIIALAIAFDFGKIVGVSILYKEWNELPKQIKYYMVAASIVLMTITSAGGAGYLSAASQKALLPTKSLQVKIDALVQEKEKLESRKKDIDNQITNLPADMVKGRTKLIANFKEELSRVNNRIVTLDQELPLAQVELIEKSSHAGPITYIAEATHTTAEQAMGVIIGLIIFVFDPLAIALILSGNYLVEKRNKKMQTIKTEIFELPAQDYISSKIETLPPDISSRLEEDLEINNIDVPEEIQIIEEPVTEEPVIEEDNMYPFFAKEQIELAKEVAEQAIVTKSSLEDIGHTPGSEVTSSNGDMSREFSQLYR